MPAQGVRLAELVAALSLGVDLGFGQPMEHVLRQCLIATRLAEQHGLDEDQRGCVYWTALLVRVGCHTDAHEQAKWFGDVLALKADKYVHDMRTVRGAAAGMRRIGSGHPVLQRCRIGLEFLVSGHRDVEHMITHHAVMSRRLAEQLGLPDEVLQAITSSYEHWDGKGWPGELKGEAIPLPGRIANLAEYVEVAHRTGGEQGVRKLASDGRGKQFDPRLTDLVLERLGVLVDGLEQARSWEHVVNDQPALTRVLDDQELDDALLAIADFIDLKSPYTLGHARALADRVEAAADLMGLPQATGRQLRRAACISSFGRLGVSNAIWDKPGPLGAGEWERVRLHPYLSERMVQQSPALLPLGSLAVQLRERLDGSGYPHRLTGAALSAPSRLLAAADAYQSMTEPRPHRPALDPDAAAKELRAEVAAGRLDGGAVDAVLTGAGHRRARRVEGPGGLTRREVEVLQLLARGLSNKQIARHLDIAPKTAGNHIEHIYAKTGAVNRASAGLFAVRHGLLPAWGERPMEQAAGPS